MPHGCTGGQAAVTAPLLRPPTIAIIAALLLFLGLMAANLGDSHGRRPCLQVLLDLLRDPPVAVRWRGCRSVGTWPGASAAARQLLLGACLRLPGGHRREGGLAVERFASSCNTNTSIHHLLCACLYGRKPLAQESSPATAWPAAMRYGSKVDGSEKVERTRMHPV